MEQAFNEAIKGQGLPFVMACIAVAFIQQMNKGLISKLNEERNEHLKTLGAQINDLKDAIVECERDRKELWAKIMEKSA
jgi:hypothetical protein